MDRRSVEWLQLLPPDTRFVVDGAPGPFRDLLAERLDDDADGAAEGYLGWATTPHALPDLTRYRSAVLVKPRGVGPSMLRAAGFSYTVGFAALPSLGATHWLAPLAGRRATVNGLGLVSPWRYRDRLKKAALTTLAYCGTLRLAGDVVLVARREPSELEVRLAGIFGRADLVLAMKTGQLKALQKTTLQVMTSDGTILGYAKLAASDVARATVEREVACLRELGRHRVLDGRVPKLLGTFEVTSAYASILAPGPETGGPASFGPSHRAFLDLLAAATERRMRFRESEMARDMDQKLQTLLPVLPDDWRARLMPAIELMDSLLDDLDLPFALAHRDFGPWNTRRYRDGTLFVYDWDNARQEMIPLYDLFSFHLLDYRSFATGKPSLAVARDLIAAGRRWMPQIDPQIVPPLLLAYLVETTLSRLLATLFLGHRRSDEALTRIGELLDRRTAWLPARTTDGSRLPSSA
ncbi:MAG: hypothetical protein IT305_13795 [Chloroflexi bacterium]|nr:hypothetical protein [Chloroflexota bacterium]